MVLFLYISISERVFWDYAICWIRRGWICCVYCSGNFLSQLWQPFILPLITSASVCPLWGLLICWSKCSLDYLITMMWQVSFMTCHIIKVCFCLFDLKSTYTYKYVLIFKSIHRDFRLLLFLPLFMISNLLIAFNEPYCWHFTVKATEQIKSMNEKGYKITQGCQ